MIQDAFWTHDYSSGVQALKDSLKGGILENKQFLAMVRERARVDHMHASQLAHLSQDPAVQAPHSVSGQAKSRKTSTLQASLDAFNAENVNSAVLYTRIATDIEKKVHEPLFKWCNMYAKKVDTLTARLDALVSRYQRLLQETSKQRSVYYERCRRHEDAGGGNSPRDPVISTIRMLRERLNAKREPAPKASSPEERTKPAEFTVAGLEYTRQELADLFNLLLGDMVLTEYKVPLLGSYQSVCSGSVLASAARRHLRNDSFAYTEKFGQSLVDLGFLKPVGQISNKFQSTHNTHYQWQPAAFELLEDASDDSGSDSSLHTGAGDASSSSGGSGNTTASHLAVSDASEESYLQAVVELDVYRCEMEVEMTQIYEFLDRLERDRVRALQAGMRDFVKVTVRIEDLHQTQLRLDTAQGSVNPDLDLADLIVRYETGPYIPTVTVFKGYYNDSIVQTFGVDLEHSRFLIDSILKWLNDHQEDAAVVQFWTHPEPIVETYKLRAQINTGRPFNAEAVFKFFSPSVVVAVFIQYLLELPESLIPFTVYDKVKQVYRAGQPEISDVVQTLMQIPAENTRALQDILEYLRDTFNERQAQDLIAGALALPLVRPRAPSSVTMHDPQPRLMISDLLARGQEIFEVFALEQTKLEERKEAHPLRLIRSSQVQPDLSPVSATSGTAGSPTPNSRRVISASTLRPLSLASPRASNLTYNSEAGDDTSVTTPIRGLAINSMLPIAVTPLGTPPTSPDENMRNVSPRQTSSPGLRPLRTSTLDLDLTRRSNK